MRARRDRRARPRASPRAGRDRCSPARPRRPRRCGSWSPSCRADAGGARAARARRAPPMPRPRRGRASASTPVALPALLEALLVDHPQRLAQPEQVRRPAACRRSAGNADRPRCGTSNPSSSVRMSAWRWAASAFGPGPHEAQAGRHHQTLLRGGEGDVDTPRVHLELLAADRGDAVDHQQRRVVGSVEGAANRRHVVAGRRGGVGVHHQHRLDLSLGVGSQPLLDRAGSIASPSAATIISTRARRTRPSRPTPRRTDRTRAPAPGRHATACSTAPSPTHHGRC